MSTCKQHNSVRHQQAKILTGFIIITFGVLFLLERTGANIPHWLVSWESILISAGIVTLYKHKFRTFSGYMMILVGGIFMVNEIHPHTLDSKIIFPIIIILLGIGVVAKTMNLFGSKKNTSSETFFDENIDMTSENFIKSSTTFGGVTKNVVSKNFEGADLSTSFGETVINLSQADIQKPVTIHSTTTFGGLKVIVPSNWEINSEIVTVLGGVEDKRSPMSDVTRDPSKVLILKGNCTFGGVEILSYI